MTPAPVEVVRRALAAQAAGDRETLVALCDPGVVVDATRNVFNPGLHEGIEQAARWLDSIGEVWDQLRLEDVELVANEERVVVISRMLARGRGSQVDVDRGNGQIWTIRDGRIVRLEIGFTSREDVLAAAGLA